MKVLELFSGTHSVGKVVKKLGGSVVSLDRDLGSKCPWSDYQSDVHIKEDIMKWDYKKDYKKGDFDIITASPVCLWWSHLRFGWVGRKCKKMHPTEIITKEHIEEDINKYGKPMVDKVFEIIDYFEPKYWWIENPATGRMKEYITDKDFYDVDYCKYSDWGYKKRTRIWTNIKGFKPQLCKMDCENVIEIKTQEGDSRGKEEIKGDTRKLHTNSLCCGRNAKSIKNAIEKGEVIRKVHRENLGNTKQRQTVRQYKEDVKKVGTGGSRLERYRIPEKLIEELLTTIKW